MGLYASQAGQFESALALSAQACQVAEHAGNAVELPNRRLDHARVLLRCEQPEAALDLLQSGEKSFPLLDVSLLRAEALLSWGNQAEAHDQLQQAYELMYACAAVEGTNVVLLVRLRADALAQRF